MALKNRTIKMGLSQIVLLPQLGRPLPAVRDLLAAHKFPLWCMIDGEPPSHEEPGETARTMAGHSRRTCFRNVKPTGQS